MTEKEKMLNEKWFDGLDKELKLDRLIAKQTCNLLDNCITRKQKKEILETFVKGETPYIEDNFFCSYGYNIIFGKNFFGNRNLTILDVGKVKIGNNVKIGTGATIIAGTHPKNKEERIKGLEKATPVIIKDDVWIGANVTIIGPITIESGTIIGAGEIVKKNNKKDSLITGEYAKEREEKC